MFEIGDNVRLKGRSKSPMFTIIGLPDGSRFSDCTGKVLYEDICCTVIWFDVRDQLQTAKFIPEILVKC